MTNCGDFFISGNVYDTVCFRPINTHKKRILILLHDTIIDNGIMIATPIILIVIIPSLFANFIICISFHIVSSHATDILLSGWLSCTVTILLEMVPLRLQQTLRVSHLCQSLCVKSLLQCQILKLTLRFILSELFNRSLQILNNLFFFT